MNSPKHSPSTLIAPFYPFRVFSCFSSHPHRLWSQRLYPYILAYPHNHSHLSSQITHSSGNTKRKVWFLVRGVVSKWPHSRSHAPSALLLLLPLLGSNPNLFHFKVGSASSLFYHSDLCLLNLHHLGFRYQFSYLSIYLSTRERILLSVNLCLRF